MKQPNTTDLAPAFIAALTLLLPVLITAAAIVIGARP